MDKNSLEVIPLAKNDAQVWQLAQVELHTVNNIPLETDSRNQERLSIHVPNNYGYQCYIDGLWKESDKFSRTW